MNETDEPEFVYRVVHADGSRVYTGRGSDPFTSVSSARRRATQLTRAGDRWRAGSGEPCKVQRAAVVWEDM